MNIYDDITLIMVTYRSEELIKKNLDILKNFKLIIVDNSNSKNLKTIVENFKNIKVIISKENLGYGKAANLAISYAKTPLILTINPDLLITEEGLKDWAKNLAMAGVIVAGLAGINSVQDAIDRSVPAVAAMETALEMAQDQGNDELAKMIKNDLSAVKVRLSSGKDLNFVKGMQDKYSKFVKTEGLAYESKLAIMLNQQLK